MLVVLMGFVALAVDVGLMDNVKSELQNAADAAALAGASAVGKPPATIRNRAIEYAAAQTGMADPDVQIQDVLLGRWDKSYRIFTPLTGDAEKSANAVKVTTQMTQARGNPVQLLFANVFGKSTAEISASAVATRQTGKPWNVVITQDITNSFTNEIADARKADQALLDCIRANWSDESEVGIVAFTGAGQVIAPIVNVGEGYDLLSAKIAGLKPCGSTGMPKCSGTNIGAGIDSAIAMLQTLDSPHDQAIIIVSDGMPQSSLKGYTDADLANWAVNSADEADALGISVFTLFYGGNDTRAGAADFLAGLVRGRGTAHFTLSAAEMSVKLKEMCESGLPLMLVE